MNLLRKIYLALSVIALTFIVYSCANKAQGPMGGPKDETPPKVVKSTPLNGALNFKKKEIQIIFDENISIDKPNDNVLISPPQLKQPLVKGNARVVTINFEEELVDSTTYTVNFGNAIVDLNEKNQLKDYRFAFSTGNVIDTLRISGHVINAENLNPISGIYVGIYRENEDSAFFQKPFLRIGKTNENGEFVIDNIKAGKYQVYALGDVNKDYFYQPGEGVAFIDSLVVPTFRLEEMRDTVWEDSVTIDSVRTYMGTKFLPDNILMRFFKESKKRQYLIKNERKQAEMFQLFFNASLAKDPVIKPLNFSWDNKYILQKNNASDTLSYWITDSAVYRTDTLTLTVSYLKTDSVFNLVEQTDTLEIFSRKPKINPKAKKDNPQPVKNFYKFSTNASGAFDVYNPIFIKFEAPLQDVDLGKINLSEKVDSTFKALKPTWSAVDSTGLIFKLEHVWEPEKSYELKIDSAAFRSIYQLNTDKYSSQFKVKSLEEYSALKLSLEQFDSLVVFQVLDTKDVVLRTKPASKAGTLFEFLKPGDYYVRTFVDKNRNGLWDTGDINNRLHPEEVFYSPKKLSLRANWEFEETLNLQSLPLLQQKPAELKKDAAKAAKQ
jgi:uncharacterized protein (DUF2141 family)